MRAGGRLAVLGASGPMRRLLALWSLLLPACLSSPPDAIGDGDGGGSDATVGPDGAPLLCASSLSLDFRTPEDLAGWNQENGKACAQTNTIEGLEFTNFGGPSNCRTYADGLVRLTNSQRLRIQLIDHDPDLSMSFSVVIGAPDRPLAERRWLYYLRDNGVLMFGECSEAIGDCDDTFWGSLPYDAGAHSWLSFKYPAGGSTLELETSSDGNTFNLVTEVDDVPQEDIACVAIDLGSYEDDTTGANRTSVFADLIFE